MSDPTIREPVPTGHETPQEYHEEHLRFGRWLDGRCLVCFPSAPSGWVPFGPRCDGTGCTDFEHKPGCILFDDRPQGSGGDTVDPDTDSCGLTWSTGYDDTESCGEDAVACSFVYEQGRCYIHCDDFTYLEAWGNIPKPKYPFKLLVAPSWPHY